MPSGNRHEHLESLSHFFDGPIADQQRFAVRIDFALDGVDLRALELQVGQERKDRQCGVGDGRFTGENRG